MACTKGVESTCTLHGSNNRGYLCVNACVKQEAQLMLTNLRDAFIGQSRSSNILLFHIIRYSFLLCSSNFVFLRYSTSKMP